jgi:hypothetical protein
VVKSKKAQKLGVAYGGMRSYSGLKMSVQTKKIGCMALKEMVEGDKLILNDFEIISELSTFVSKGQSYEASSGYHDDLVSSLVLFGWMTSQPYFQDLTNVDTRRKIYEEKIKKLEEDLVPFGFLENQEEDLSQSIRELSKESSGQPIIRSDWGLNSDEII